MLYPARYCQANASTVLHLGAMDVSLAGGAMLTQTESRASEEGGARREVTGRTRLKKEDKRHDM
jgi:hypothetical protein